MTETTVARLPRRAVAGVLSNLQRFEIDGLAVVSATLTTTFRDTTLVRGLKVAGEVIDRVEHLLEEGPVVRFYGEVNETDVLVLGPDLTKRTLAREAAARGEAPATAPAPAKAAKRPQTEAQKRAWAEVILPSLQAGRARKAAERQAEKAAAAEAPQAA